MSLRRLRSCALLLTVAIWPVACARHRNPQSAFDHAVNVFQSGDLEAASNEAEEGYSEFHKASPSWGWQFFMLRARIFYWRGLNSDALGLLASESTLPTGDLTAQKLRIEAVAYASLHKFSESEKKILELRQLCSGDLPACRDLGSTLGRIEMEREHYASASGFYSGALVFARASKDRFAEATALVNLSWSANEQTRFDEALGWANAAREITIQQKFGGLDQKALGNAGWAYYKLGDPGKAQVMFTDARKQAEKLGDWPDQVRWLTTAGYIFMDARDIKGAYHAFRQALSLARKINSREDIINSLIALAFVSEESNKVDDAKCYAKRAFAMAKADNGGRDQVYPLLVQGRIASRLHDTFAAENGFRAVANSGDAPDFLKWEAERSLARLKEDENQPAAAEEEYRTALSTFETARSELHHEDSRLPFLNNAARMYDDYIRFLIAQGRPDEALQVTEYSRGRTLNEGLGVLEKVTSFAPEPLDPQAIARYARGTILFYWLGEEQSYVWVITPRETRLFPLNAPSKEIDEAVHSYRKKLEGPPEILKASSDGSMLYKMLIRPAEDFLAKGALAKNNQIFVIPDGSLNSLNFETLMPAPQHYWIEDVTITSAGSLHLLASARPAPKQLAGKLLLMGDPIPPPGEDEYARLPFAAQEVKAVARRFAGNQSRELTRELTEDHATPGAYLNGHPEQFSYIHFIAHGEASRPSPLDSAIILSRDPASKAATGEDNSFKLYARDIVQHPLHAELVTISACYGSGKRSYSGEGLVGLSWAFLRAGAHNVVGALWDVSSISSAQLMDDFYGELQKGRSPSAALRAAKLNLLHSSNTAFNSPFYWAPFQLYTGASRAFPPRPAENNMR